MTSRARFRLPKSVVRGGLGLLARALEHPVAAKASHRLILRSRMEGARDPFAAPGYRFLARVLLERNRSRSQIFQDLWVLHELNERRGGFFVEFGAADGLYLSNTWLLEKEYGWRGILAEPAPSWHEALRRNRSAEISTACVFPVSGEKVALRIPRSSAEFASACENFAESPHAGEFAAFDTLEVETVSLVDLLRRHHAPSEIDYISMDVEGGEADILGSFDFSTYRVRLWSIEHNGPERKAVIDRVMTEQGYVRCFPEFSLFDGWYRLDQ